MADLPRGVPFIDLLVPAGIGAKVEDLQTRIDLVSGGAWAVRADDGTMEDSLVPTQPMRGSLERFQVYRQQPYMPGESLQSAASLAIELAADTQAVVAAMGVYGAFAWGIVLVEDVRWLHGLVLLDWLYNPRLDADGEVVEDPDPALAESTLSRKLTIFHQLWVPHRSAGLMQRLPPGALQPVGAHLALILMGQGGEFDPRYWQGFSMQIALAEVRALAGNAPPEAETAPQVPAAAPEPAIEAPPDDGLTALARAQKQATERAAERAAKGLEEEVEEVDDTVSGPAVGWAEGSRGRLLWVPADRLDAGFLRSVRDGSVDGLGRSERPSQPELEAWVSGGAHFVTEVAFYSRLFSDGTPVHKGTWDSGSVVRDGYSTFDGHLPRVSRVRAVLVPAEGANKRRILVCSDMDLPAAEVVATATE